MVLRKPLIAATVLIAVLVGAHPASAVAPSHFVDTDEFSFDPSITIANIGEAVEWSNIGSVSHTATAERPFRIFNTGTIMSGQQQDATMGYGGTYPYRCLFHTSMSGTIRVRPEVLPESVAPGEQATVRFGTSAPPSGKGMDVQVRRESGAWRDYRKGRTGTQVVFVPETAGTFWFRVRMRRLKDDSRTPWSPVDSLMVA
ncbi:MAG: hypothetical protein WD757_04080 [Actinomycetota bacterium]